MVWRDYFAMTLTTPYEYATNITGLGDLVVYLNGTTSGWLSYGLLCLVSMLGMFVGTAAGDFSKGLTVGSFIGFIFSVYFVRLGIMAAYIPGLLIAMTIIGILMILGERY